MTDDRLHVVEQEPYNAEVLLSEVERAPGEGALFVRTHFDVPAIKEDDHRLRVDGAPATAADRPW